MHAHDTVQGVSYRLPRHCQYSLTALSVEQHRAHTYTHTSTIEQYSISLSTLYLVQSYHGAIDNGSIFCGYIGRSIPVRSGVPNEQYNGSSSVLYAVYWYRPASTSNNRTGTYRVSPILIIFICLYILNCYSLSVNKSQRMQH